MATQHPNVSAVMPRLLSHVLICLASICSACAQTPGLSLQERLFEGRIEPIDSIGVRTFVERADAGRVDSAEVYFNIHGQPVAWRAWIGGRYYVYWQPYGRFTVSDSALVALDVFRNDRRLLEMLEGMELVEQAAKKSQ